MNDTDRLNWLETHRVTVEFDPDHCRDRPFWIAIPEHLPVKGSTLRKAIDSAIRLQEKIDATKTD